MSARFVVLGLARVRAPWFTQMSSWSNSSALPVEFLKCVSASEVHNRIDTGRAISAALIDANAPGADRDLIDHVLAAGAAVIIVRGDGADRDWERIGATSTLTLPLVPAEVLAALEELSEPIDDTIAASEQPESPPEQAGWLGHLVTVVGAGGSGTSVVAAAAAQGLARQPGNMGQVALVDLALDADQAMYHSAPDVIPGLQELVEAHRGAHPSQGTVLGMFHDVADRNYSLLLGLRRHRDWTSLQPRSAEAAIRSVRRLFRWTVADIDGDIDGEGDTGSLDIEERNFLSRHCLRSASCVLLTATPTVRGIHRLVSEMDGLDALGIPQRLVQPVITSAPRSRRSRSEITRTIARLTGGRGDTSPLFLARRPLEAMHRSATPLPHAMCASLVPPIERISSMARQAHPGEPIRIKPTRLPGDRPDLAAEKAS